VCACQALGLPAQSAASGVHAQPHAHGSDTFFAGQPYFLKEGRMDNVQEHRIEAMRDDEWVFSGYSFNWPALQKLIHEL